MSQQYNLDLTEEVMTHFEKILLTQPIEKEVEIINSINNAIQRFKENNVDDYITSHLETLENMVQMISDKQWRMPTNEKQFLLSALQYFIDEDDIIPDNTPVIGLLDDCIMIDIVENKLKAKIQAYNEFKKAARIYAFDDTYSTKDWVETKRKEAFSRLRHRRFFNKTSHKSRGTSFSIK